jgi:hypothetical protein
MTAEYTKADGEKVKNTLKVYDVYARELDNIPNLANGAIMNVSLNAFITEYQGKKGVSLGLQKVQLIDYKEYDGGGDEFEAEANLPESDEDEIKPEGL